MSDRVTITFDKLPAQPVELDGLSPDRTVSLSTNEIAALPVWIRGQPVPLSDVATISGDRSANLRLEGDLSRAEGVGAGMCGGVLEVAGSVGDGAGVAMTGGVLRLAGDAGARLGAALPGASRGMTGGEIIVHGRAGAEAGAYARRGLIIVRGEVGANAARGMIAGTLVTFAPIGADAGAWNKRGSIVAAGGATVPATYRFACTYEPTMLRTLFVYLQRAHGIVIESRFVTGPWRRYCGDISECGKGELLTWAGAQ